MPKAKKRRPMAGRKRAARDVLFAFSIAAEHAGKLTVKLNGTEAAPAVIVAGENSQVAPSGSELLRHDRVMT